MTIVRLWTLVLCEADSSSGTRTESERQCVADMLFVSAAGREQQQGGARRMDVHLPSVRPEEEEVMEESLSAAADTDSSTTDVF